VWKNCFAVVFVFLFLATACLFTECVFGQTAIGVKQGDWVEYNVTTTGSPPKEHNVTWSRLEVMSVQGSAAEVNVTSKAPDGSISSLIMTLNVESGQIGAWWLIPANLDVGDSFYDDFLKQNITITGEEQLEYAGAIRTITNTTLSTRIKQWDKVTGIFVLSADELPTYSINVKAYATNLWSPQILGLEQGFFYALLAVSIILVIAGAFIAIFMRGRLRKHAS